MYVVGLKRLANCL